MRHEDVTQLTFEDMSFDALMSLEVLEHVPAVERACKEIARVARHEVVIGVPYKQDTRLGRTKCSNCGKVVCRRCSQRRREVALCRKCAGLETRAQNPDFARVLLKRSQRQVGKLRSVTRTVLAVLVPGFGLIAFRRALTPLLVIAIGLLLVGPFAGTPLPFELEPLVGRFDRLPSSGLRIAVGAAIYAVSIAGYFSLAARASRHAAALTTSTLRPAAQAPRRLPAQAA